MSSPESAAATRSQSAAPTTLPERRHSSRFWSDPAQFRDTVPRLAVLLLNAHHCAWHIRRQIDPRTRNHATELFWNLWSNAHVTLCADGGANRLYDRSVQVDAQELVVPQYIKGDLDSLRDDVRAFYAARGSKIIQDPDQDTNDLDKCLQLLRDLQDQQAQTQEQDPLQQQRQQQQSDKWTVMIFGAMGGRFDQEVQNLNALFRWHDVFAGIVLLSEDTTARLLMPGERHVIEPNFAFETRTCGLIPVAGACTSTVTTGLKWDLDGSQEMRFGGLISTSNHIQGEDDPEDAQNGQGIVTVECSQPLIWSTELKK